MPEFFLELYRKFTSFLLIIASFLGILGSSTKRTTQTAEVNGSLVTVDALGRSVMSAGKSEKQVGIFYFLWMGEHGTGGPYDNTKIVAEHPEAILSQENWVAAGGGQINEFHFWGEPLFGYHQSKDTWVLRKDVQMLTDAGIDFIVFDTTNSYIYSEAVEKLISVWYEYLLDGWDVPKIAYYTYSESGDTMNRIYDEIYNNAELNARYPRLSELWYRIDDGENAKPMIVGKADDSKLRDDVKSYFRIKAGQWPNADKNRDGFPWMEFDRNLTLSALYKNSLTDKSIANVSVAQHCNTISFSTTAWYGGNDHSRSWHDGAIDKSENAVLHGYNFEEQWQFANKLDPDVVFVTGWNEWVVQRGFKKESEPIWFCDSADTECSRDCAPSAGILGDNYYMQLVKAVAEFKGTSAVLKTGKNVTIDIDGDFSQWNNENITAIYRDYKNDTQHRDYPGFGNLRYTDATGRNDIVNAKVTQDAGHIYFYVDTAEQLTAPDGGKWMNLLISTSDDKQGYDFCINRTAPENGKTNVERVCADGTYVLCGEASVKFEGNKLMIAVAKSSLDFANGENTTFNFKWADNCDINDVYSFYKNGDCAPYGRLNYKY